MAAPANDNVANAQVLTSGTQVTGDTTDATVESGETRGASNTPGPSVWYQWTCPVPSPGPVQVDTIGSSFDTHLAIYLKKVTTPAGPPDLQYIASDDDAGGGGTSMITFTPLAGVQYWFQVAGYGSGDKGSFVFNYPTPGTYTAPTNDNIANAVTLQPGTTSYRHTENFAATSETSEVTGTGDSTSTIT